MKKITFLIFTIFIAFNVKAQKTEISLNLEIGKIYTQKMSSVMDMNQNIQNQDINSKINIGGETTFLVKSISNDIYELEVVYKSLNMGMETANTKLDFGSSKNDPNDIFSQLMAGFKDKPFLVKMTKKGAVVEIQNLDKLIEGLFTSMPNVPEGQKEALMQQFNKSFGPEKLKGSIEGVSLIYPSKPVNIGEQWITITKLPSAEFEAQLTTTYTLLEKNKDDLVIKGTGIIETLGGSTNEKVKQMFEKFDMNGTFTSIIKIDAKSGWIINAKTNQNLIGDITMKKTDAMPENMKMSMVMTNEMLITDK